MEKEIIEMLKKKKEKEAVISKCDNITSQISRLIDARLSALNKTKTQIGWGLKQLFDETNCSKH